MHRFGRIIQNLKNTRHGTAFFNLMPLCTLQQGAVESASLTTVGKDQSSQFPDRDEDLLASLQLLANGDSTNLRFDSLEARHDLPSFFDDEKINRLINRAELVVKFPSMSYEQRELELFTNVTDACKKQKYWTAKRAVEGVRIVFKDPFACVSVIEPPRKRS
ncbi:hypothetical protein PsorP6_014003 [Peronosclerospora sorghi]|uniref:Uncharacterized protein n=1 Tax=Peronosclerospora sorghi TaxID=230839 RepID=A0ACC0VGN3_9STRA|nr:hypothetical protein PsorP6_014003 [Peronosclerospora sorghi]